MKPIRILLALALTALLAGLPAGAAENLSDPYEILRAHYEALGGLERLKSEKTRYLEGTITVMGMEGTIKDWEERPDRKRREMDLGIVKMTMGDNGEFSWIVDMNGKLQVQKDEATLKKRRVEALMASYDHVNPESEHFTVSFIGTEKVGDVDCYVVEISNNINEDMRREYFSTATLHTVKTVAPEEGFEVHVLYSDYRDVDGLMIPFHQEAEVQTIGQKQTMRITKYETNPDIDRSLFEPPTSDAEDFEFLGGDRAEDIPFDFILDHLYIDVEVNSDSRRWVLDTGASATVIDSAYAAELGLEPAGEIKALGAGGQADVSLVTLPPFSIQGIRFGEQTVGAMPIGEIFRRRGIEIAGILGYDFLSRFVTRIDYASQRISFYDPADFTYDGLGCIIDAPLKHRLFHLPMTVDGAYSGDWGLDIGASVSAFHYPFAEENSLLERDGIERMAGGAGGHFKIRVSQFDMVDIGGYTVSSPVFMVPLESLGALSLERTAGVLGNNVLRRFILYLDYERQRIILEKGADFDRDFPRDKGGLSVVLTDDGAYEVFFVSPGTPAEKAGFIKGDIVKSINGIDMDRFAGPVAISDMFKAAAGTEYRVEIQRAGETQTLKIELADLY